jgi:hypothetical protein
MSGGNRMSDLRTSEPRYPATVEKAGKEFVVRMVGCKEIFADRPTSQLIFDMTHAAYEMGYRHAQEALRAALGLEMLP